ncbi:uncharacterized protein [Phaseolus vulgaris]|uniref:uncharacterized protein n=1 Tax=Phaseolus vulgaris TaxID=3885 RepID=UPI0035CA6A43
MPGIDPDFLCHHLSMDATVRPVRQRRRKFNEERQLVVREETQKLLSAGHIREIQYPEWLANVVLVKKANGKWRMCVDFTDLNKACPKDSYPLPSIDALVDSASVCKVLSFLDAFSGYNQIKMHPRDESKTAFMTETCNYCYKVMPFGLKNAGSTYQRLMDKVLAPMLGRNVYAYVDDMVVASKGRTQHVTDLEELFVTISKYRLKLNPEKCVFGVEAGKLLGFMLTERGIEANPDKCAAIIAMRSPTSVKEVQQLTERMAALSRTGYQFYTGPGAGPNTKAHLFREQGFTRPRDEVPVAGKGSVGRGVFGQEAPPLLPQFYSSGDDEPPHTKDFVAELSPGGEQEVEAGTQWSLSVDGYSNGVLIEQALRFAFKASNNQAEYEALIAGMLLAKEMGVQTLLVKSDSQLITGQVSGEFQAKDPQMAAYLRYVQLLKGAFSALKLIHVPREQNARADLLAKLASSGKGGRQKTVIQETLKALRKFIEDNRVDVLHISTARGRPRSHRSLTQDTVKTPHISTYTDTPEGGRHAQIYGLAEGDTWMTPYRRYLADGVLPTEPEEGKKVKRNAARYTLVDGAAGIRQWNPVRQPTVEEPVRRGGHQASVRISRTPPN